MCSLCDSCVLESTRATGDPYSVTDSNNYACRGSDPATPTLVSSFVRAKVTMTTSPNTLLRQHLSPSRISVGNWGSCCFCRVLCCSAKLPILMTWSFETTWKVGATSHVGALGLLSFPSLRLLAMHEAVGEFVLPNSFSKIDQLH